MDQFELYKDFRSWRVSGMAGAMVPEAKKPFDANAEYIATPSGHQTPEAAIAFIKQMIDSSSTTIKAPKTI